MVHRRPFLCLYSFLCAEVTGRPKSWGPKPIETRERGRTAYQHKWLSLFIGFGSRDRLQKVWENGQMHCTKNLIYVFSEMKLHGLIPLHSCTCERFIYSQDRSQIHECGNWETKHYYSVLEITRPCSFISGNTSIGIRHLLDSHQPFICSVYRPKYKHIFLLKEEHLSGVL